MKSNARFSNSMPEFLSNRCATVHGVIRNKLKNGKLANRKTTQTDECSTRDKKLTDELSILVRSVLM